MELHKPERGRPITEDYMWITCQEIKSSPYPVENGVQVHAYEHGPKSTVKWDGVKKWILITYKSSTPAIGKISIILGRREGEGEKPNGEARDTCLKAMQYMH